MSDAMLRAALKYSDMGWPVFPLVIGDKVPITSNGVKDATINQAIIRAWWTKYPRANIGLACGALVAVDLDVKPSCDGRDTWRELDIDDDGAVINLTPSGGMHLIFRNTEGRPIPNSVSKIGECVDIRGAGGYIVLPPSVHPNGKRYAWDVGAHPLDMEPGPIPLKLYKLIMRAATPGPAPAAPPQIPNGHRNQALMSLAGTMRRRGLTAEEIYPSLWAVNKRRCLPPLTEREVVRIAKSAVRYEAKGQRLAPPEPERPKPLETNGNRDYWNSQYKDRWGKMRHG